jgi:hypothetical protein
MGVFWKKLTPNVEGRIILSSWDKVDKTILLSLHKRKCYCRIEWQPKVEWLGMVENLKSCSLQEIMKDMGKVLNWWPWKHWIVFLGWRKLMKGAKGGFWWIRTCVFHCICIFWFSIPYSLNLVFKWLHILYCCIYGFLFGFVLWFL